MVIDYNAIGAHLRALRKERGETITDVAAHTPLQGHVIAAIEKGTKQPTIYQLHVLARAYGVRLEIGIGATTKVDQ